MNFLQLTSFEIRRQLKSPLFWMALAATIVLLLFNMRNYVSHYPLASPTDYEAIIQRRNSDVRIPTGSERNVYFASQMVSDSYSDVVSVEVKQFILSLMEGKSVWTPEEMTEIGRKVLAAYPMQGRRAESFANEYAYSTEKMATYEELLSYIENTGEPFSASMARAYGETMALMICLATLCMYAFLFHREMQPSYQHLILSKPLSSFTFVISKLAGCILMAFSILTLNTVIISVWVSVTIPSMHTFDFFRAAVFYVIPSLLFVLTITTLASVIFKNGFVAIPLLLIMTITSGFQTISSDGAYVQSMLLAPFVNGMTSFFTPPSPERMQTLILNRMILLALSVFLSILLCFVWSRTQRLSQKTRKGRKRSVVYRPRRTSFLLQNSRIFLNPLNISLTVILAISTLITDQISHIVEIGPKILSMTTWASVILFAGVYSVEYDHNTKDSLFLTPLAKWKIIGLRVTICIGILLVLITGLFILLFFFFGMPETTIFAFLQNYLQTVLSCTVACLFTGLCAMTLSNISGNGWIGIAGGILLTGALQSVSQTFSPFNPYILRVQYLHIDKPYVLLQSALIYIGISFLLFLLNGTFLYKNTLQHTVAQPNHSSGKSRRFAVLK